MILASARLGLAASAAVLFIAGAAVLPAAAQQKIYPSGTDCTKLIGSDKSDCELQMRNTASPDYFNNPDNSAINTANPPAYEQQPIGAPSAGASGNGVNTETSTTHPASGDCTSMVGDTKKACEQRSKNSPSPDNSNNPDQTN